MFRRRFAGEDHLVVVQPDGTLALVPSWMAEPVAALGWSSPRGRGDHQSVGSSSCARASINVEPPPTGNRPREEEAIMCPPYSGQERDLFEADRTLMEFPVAQRCELVRLIECLLTEALAACEARVQSDGAETKEAVMSKITAEHLGRGAFVYVRQSTADQVSTISRSTSPVRLADRARALGWTDVEVIDDDSAVPAVASPAPALRSCWQRSAKDGSAPSSRSRPRESPATAATGIRCSSSAVGRHTDPRQGRRLRSSPSERSTAARHEGHDERDGAVGTAPALARGPEAEGAPR